MNKKGETKVDKLQVSEMNDKNKHADTS